MDTPRVSKFNNEERKGEIGREGGANYRSRISRGSLNRILERLPVVTTVPPW